MIFTAASLAGLLVLAAQRAVDATTATGRVSRLAYGFSVPCLMALAAITALSMMP